jgi:hypothetical protein
MRQKRWFGVDGDADNFLRSVGSVQRRKRMFSQELEQKERKPF